MNFVLSFVMLLLQALSVVILIRSFISWLTPGQSNLFTRTVYQISEPILKPLRRVIPTWRGLDFSPFVAIVILQVIIQILGWI